MTNATKGRKGFVSRPLEERFWSKVAKAGPDQCWLWTGAKARHGYGQIWRDGKRARATHVAWELANHAPFPSGMLACHTCDTPSCVNPAHIWPGTMSENIRDCVGKGRHVAARIYGPKPHLAKLTDDAVREIRSASGTIWLARKYGVSKKTIQNVRRGLIYKHIDAALTNGGDNA